MQAASRESLALARERLDEYADTADLGRLADQLFAVATVLVREAMLRRALSDPARSAASRRELGDEVFGRHVDQTTGRVVAQLASARWSRPVDLIDAFELLGVQAVLTGAEREGVLAEVEDELFRFGRTVAAHPALAALLGDQAEPLDRRRALARDLLAGRAMPQTERLVEVALAGLGGRGFEASLDRLSEMAADRRDRTVAHVRVAAPLGEEQEQRLAATLRETYGREISVQVEIDPAVLGGATVRIGEDMYDGSLARRLAQVRASLTRR